MTNKKSNRKNLWEKGESGNPAGRPKGATNKQLTSEEIAELLSKRVKGAYDTVMRLMLEEKNPNVKLKAALAIITEDDKARARILDETQKRLKIEKDKLELEKAKRETRESTKDNSDKEETPVLSLKAVK